MLKVLFIQLSGHPLSITQADIPVNGWAVECRVYAEVRDWNFVIGCLSSHNSLLLLLSPTSLLYHQKMKGAKCDKVIYFKNFHQESQTEEATNLNSLIGF